MALADPSFPTIARLARGGIETLLLALVAFSPWAFGSVHPLALLVIYCGIGLALGLWALSLLADGRPPRIVCPVAVCIAGMVLLGVLQVVPLPSSVLGIVAPGSERTWVSLLPVELEVIAGDEAQPPLHTLSLYPHATRDQVLKLLAVFAVFILARYAVASIAALKRLAVVCVVNGALLSLFALFQQFSSPKKTLYWTFESTGAVFGPFICRNHFSFFVNICVGLGLGLLLSRLTYNKRRGEDWRNAVFQAAVDPAAVWLLASIGLMIAADLYSQSRGGVLALIAAVLVCLLFRLAAARDEGNSSVQALLLSVGVVAGLAAWFGVNRVEKRLQTIWSGDALGDGRARLWERTLPMALEHPVWGAGYGTFDFLETTRREPRDASIFRFEYAHNDYLQTLLEGGVVHLALALVAIIYLYRHILTACRVHSKSATTIVGAMIGLTTVVIHSFGDFGLHIPSIVLLTTCLAGLVVGLGAPAMPATPNKWLSIAIALSCLILAGLLPLQGWRAERAERLRLAALRARSRSDLDAMTVYLEAASRLSPDDGLLWMQLGEARRGLFETHESDPDGKERYLMPALQAYRQARNANPLLVEPHLWLGVYQNEMTRADPARVYLKRAASLTPSDARVWYLSGALAAREGAFEEAWPAWRRSLECSSKFLPDILKVIAGRPDGASVLTEVLPDDPRVLKDAVGDPSLIKLPVARNKLLQRALVSAGSGGDAKSRYRRGWLLRELGESDKAIAEYTNAVDLSPGKIEWQLELVELLIQSKKFDDAIKQLRQVLNSNPKHEKARELLRAAVRKEADPP